jgi:hypothetical protein
MLLGQLFIRILLDEDGLFQIVHNLQDQDQLLLTNQLHPLEVGSDYLTTPVLQLPHLVLPVLINALADHEETALHAVHFLLHCGLELLEGVLRVGIWLLLEAFKEAVHLLLDALEEEVGDVDALALLKLEYVQDHLIQSRALAVVLQQQLETVASIVLSILLIL